jgi:DNA repair protein RecN (Recombination protein N)
MLRLLRIKNLANISSIDLEFEYGFNVLTGQTGIGKSVIVHALELIAGSRVDSNLVKSGQDSANIQAVFELDEPLTFTVNNMLSTLGVDFTPGDNLVISRELNRENRNICRVNGDIIPLRSLKQLSEILLDIHGQSDHLSILKISNQIDLLDKYAGLSEERSALEKLYIEMNECIKEIENFYNEVDISEEGLDLLRFQYNEIENANLLDNEDSILIEEQKEIQNLESLKLLSNEGYKIIYGDDLETTSYLTKITNLAREINALNLQSPQLSDLQNRLLYIISELEDLGVSFRKYRDDLQYSESRLSEIEERLSLIFKLKRRFGNGIAEILKFADSLKFKLNLLDEKNNFITDKQNIIADLQKQIERISDKISKSRTKAAIKLAADLHTELTDLSMESTSVQVLITELPYQINNNIQILNKFNKNLVISRTGKDKVEFLMSDRGNPLLPLNNIVSGGEASRLMLGLRIILSEIDNIPLIVFDEIDSGVGGRLGVMLGIKFIKLSQMRQVFCITHLPQVASFADHHIKLLKVDYKDGFEIDSQILNESGKIAEISDMLGDTGDQGEKTAIEMLELAKSFK